MTVVLVSVVLMTFLVIYLVLLAFELRPIIHMILLEIKNQPMKKDVYSIF